MKRLLLVAGASIIGLGLLTGGIGLLLDPVVHAHVTTEIAQPPEKVYALLADMESVGKWSPEVGKVERIGDNPPRYKASAGPMESVWTVVEAQPPRLLRSRMEGHSMSVSGDWRTQIEPTASGGSRVDHRVAMEFHNPWLRVLSRMMDVNQEEAKTLADLKRYLESHP
jgi:uncharacterized membrane protein